VIRFLAKVKIFALLQRVQIGSEVHPASYPKDTNILLGFLGFKTAVRSFETSRINNPKYLALRH